MKKYMKKIISSTLFLWALPLFVFAQFSFNLGLGGQGSNPFLNILSRVKDILDLVVPIVITLALIYFIYGVASYITAGDDEKKAEARDVMIYGTIGLFFIVSIWGIVALLQQFTGVAGSQLQRPAAIPGVPRSGGSSPTFNIGTGGVDLNIPLLNL